ncbi:MAG: hypothetical protein LBH18_00835 [Spirochaetaceae bacterium]|nr:hypothetical protein [Spirochaetaceae bacterium]
MRGQRDCHAAGLLRNNWLAMTMPPNAPQARWAVGSIILLIPVRESDDDYAVITPDASFTASTAFTA